MKEWVSWKTTTAHCKELVKLLKKTSFKPADIAGKGILEVAEAFDDEGKYTKADLSKIYKHEMDKGPSVRWATVDITVVLTANEVTDDE